MTYACQRPESARGVREEAQCGCGRCSSPWVRPSPVIVDCEDLSMPPVRALGRPRGAPRTAGACVDGARLARCCISRGQHTSHAIYPLADVHARAMQPSNLPSPAARARTLLPARSPAAHHGASGRPVSAVGPAVCAREPPCTPADTLSSACLWQRSAAHECAAAYPDTHSWCPLSTAIGNTCSSHSPQPPNLSAPQEGHLFQNSNGRAV
jgi:hypothetical protein